MNIIEAYDVVESALSALGSESAEYYTDYMRENAFNALDFIYELACMNEP